ncbi:hypothetical protein HHK36_027573 [Tetracentron sinense]|uniref:Uncharacterized protein n=1 Tax=Tetracentron sinense TaxID=13715 RepID=A0A834YE95_TETSI|nr:hypothetical protein HHK36_027573 [Tetracentron sinense]
MRTAHENLEDQLEFFHISELCTHNSGSKKNAAQLEQSYIVLAMRLANHNIKKYKVIEESLAFVGDVHVADHFISPGSQSGEKLEMPEGKRSNILMQVLVSSFNFARKSLRLEPLGEVIAKAVMVTVSMLALPHHQIAFRNNFVVELLQMQEDFFYSKRNVKNTSQLEGSSSSGRVCHLDVLLARG